MRITIGMEYVMDDDLGATVPSGLIEITSYHGDKSIRCFVPWDVVIYIQPNDGDGDGDTPEIIIEQ